MNLGNYNTSGSFTTVSVPFGTFAAAGGNVAPNSAFEAADIRIYRKAHNGGLSATQRSSSNGITMTSPFDSLTGFHNVDIDLTDNTDSGFYADGYEYFVVLSPDETVDSQTINAIPLAKFTIGVPAANVTQFGGTSGTFSSGRPEVNTTHWGGTAVASATVNANMTQISGDSTAADNLEAATDGTGYNVGNGSIVAASVTGAVGSVTGNVGGNVTGTIGGLTAAALKDFFDTDSTTTYASAVAGSVVKEIADNAGGASLTLSDIADAVWDEAQSGHLTAGTFGQRLAIIRANTAAGGASGSITLDASASATDDFYNNNLVHITAGTGAGQARFIEDYTGSSKVATVSPNWVTTPDNTSVFVVTPFDTLPGTSAPSAADVADAVWDEARAGHVSAGSFGEGVASVQGNVTGSTASVAGAVGSVTGNVGGNVVGTVASVVGNVGGNVTGSVGSVVGAVGSVTGNVGGNVTGTVGGFTSGAKAEIESECNDALLGQNLDHLLKSAVDTNLQTTVHDNSVLGYALAKANVSNYVRTTDSHEALGDAAATLTGLKFRLSAAFTSTAGTTLRIIGLVSQYDRRYDVYGADNTATCALAVREHGAGADLFTITATTVNANGTFELSKSSPGFTADRLYRYTATVVISGQTYTFEEAFPTLG